MTNISDLQIDQEILSLIEKNQPVFTFQLKTGWSTIKIGQSLFEHEVLNRLLSI